MKGCCELKIVKSLLHFSEHFEKYKESKEFRIKNQQEKAKKSFRKLSFKKRMKEEENLSIILEK